MGTAAALYGFDTVQDHKIHILDPGVRMRPAARLMVHQRVGAPLRRVKGRLATSPACRYPNSSTRSSTDPVGFGESIFAWPDAMLVVEYDSVEWHANPEAFKHDRIKTSRLQACGWSVMPTVVDDIRRNQFDLVARLFSHLDRTPLTG